MKEKAENEKDGDAIANGGIVNLRPVAPGVVKNGVFFRSGALPQDAQSCWDLLRGMGIRRVIDLRSGAEQRIARDVLPQDIDLVEVPLSGGSMLPHAMVFAKSVSVGDMYRNLVKHEGRGIAHAIHMVAQSDGPVLVHCTAGKDRTGIVVALTSDVIGVPRSVIVSDYAASAETLGERWQAQMLRRLASMGVPLTKTIKGIVTTSPAEAIIGVFQYIESEWGSSAEYLRRHGLPQDDVPALKKRLMAVG